MFIISAPSLVSFQPFFRTFEVSAWDIYSGEGSMPP